MVVLIPCIELPSWSLVEEGCDVEERLRRILVQAFDERGRQTIRDVRGLRRMLRGQRCFQSSSAEVHSAVHQWTK